MTTVKVKIEAVVHEEISLIAENVDLDMKEFNEITNRTLALAVERQHPEIMSRIPTWKWRQVTFQARLIITVTEEKK